MELLLLFGGCCIAWLLFSKKKESSNKESQLADNEDDLVEFELHLSDSTKDNASLCDAKIKSEILPSEVKADDKLSGFHIESSNNNPQTRPEVASNENGHDDELAEFVLGNPETVPSTPSVSTKVKPDSRSDSELSDSFSSFNERNNKQVSEKSDSVTRWLSETESVQLHGLTIEKGLFYFGRVLKEVSDYGGDVDAALVNGSLYVKAQHWSYTDETLGYWPRFSDLSPSCRGAYLNWLASSRNDWETPIGYVFIYFYGLERRVLVDAKNDGVSDPEYQQIFHEVIRLLKVFSESKSFSRYASSFIELMYIQRPTVVDLPDSMSLKSSDSLAFRFKLAQRVYEGKAVTADLALQWLRYFPEYRFRKPATRCSAEFSLLFNQLFSEKFSEGLMVKPNKTRLKLEYWPASSSLTGISVKPDNWPDPSVLKAPLKKLIEIADSCTNQLEAYSRYLSKSDTRRSDLEAVLLLPEPLETSESIMLYQKFSSWADDQINKNKGVVDVKAFWEAVDIELPAKINKKEAELMSRLANKAGYGIAPDLNIHNAKPDPDGKVVVFSGGHGEYLQVSKAFNEKCITLRLGAMLAGVDGNVDESEVNLLEQLIHSDTRLSSVEKESLNAYLTWRLNTAFNMAGLKGRLEELEKSDKLALSKHLVKVVIADGRIDPKEIKQLEKLYQLLGLDKSQVSSDIHSVSTSRQGTQVQPLSTSVEDDPSIDKKKGFTLDKSLLAQYEEDTESVQSMLDDIFDEQRVNDATNDNTSDIEQSVEQDESSEIESEVEMFFGLDIAHQQLLERLISREKWERTQVSEQTEALGLMLEGAIETINDWAFEQVDAPLIEDDGDIYIDAEILNELQALEE